MASPQLENGYTRIANEIMEALAHIRISGEARQVLDVIIRKTYGFNKKEDKIALSQFCLATGLSKQAVSKGLHKLFSMNLITKKDNAIANIYALNKDFDTWKPLPKKITLPKKIMVITKKDNLVVPKKVPTKETLTKETITKDIAALETNAGGLDGNGINLLLGKFKSVNPSYARLFSNRSQRAAIERMLRQHGFDKISRLLDYVPLSNKESYAPVITTPVQLEAKLGSLLAYFERENKKTPLAVKI